MRSSIWDGPRQPSHQLETQTLRPVSLEEVEEDEEAAEAEHAEVEPIITRTRLRRLLYVSIVPSQDTTKEIAR